MSPSGLSWASSRRWLLIRFTLLVIYANQKIKIIFMGINPGFTEEGNRKEQTFLQERGAINLPFQCELPSAKKGKSC